MNIPQQAAAAPAASQATQPTKTTLEERTSSVLAELRGSPSETAGAPTKTPAGEPAASGDDARAARRERLATLTAKDRERVDHKQRQAEQDKLARRAAEFERRATDAEALAAKRVDLDNLDEASFLALAEKKNISGDRLSAWIRDAATNPEKIAQAAALKAQSEAIDPKFAALERRLAEQDAQIQSYIAAQQKQQLDAQEAHDIQQFKGFVGHSAERAPLAARLLEHDEDEFLAMADVAGHSVPPGAGAEALLDAIEDLLDSDGGARGVYTKYAKIFGPQGTPSTDKASPPPRAAAKANTISNSLAATRTSVVEEDDFASLDLDERARRLIKQLG